VAHTEFKLTYCLGEVMNKVTLKMLLVCSLPRRSCHHSAGLGRHCLRKHLKQIESGLRPGGQTEFGDEIKLGGTMRTLSTFTFEYFLNNASGNEFIRLRLYKNDGAPVAGGIANSPGSLIYDSNFEHIDATRSTMA